MMDWDGIGTFAFFLASGGIGIGLIVLTAFRAKLKAQIELARLRGSDPGTIDDLRDEMHQCFDEQRAEIAELQERLDFTERLLAKGGEGQGETG